MYNCISTIKAQVLFHTYFFKLLQPISNVAFLFHRNSDILHKMASTIKYTLFNLILVVIIQQYISIQFPSKHKRNRRAILQEETNYTAHTSFAHAQRLTHTLDTVSIDPSLSTIAFNTTLTSEERLQQLQKLKDAEMHLRKNLREKGKEYENQLYENWPK